MQGYPEHSGARNIDEAIENANSAPYRLAAHAFTNSARNADRPAVSRSAIFRSTIPWHPVRRRCSAVSRRAVSVERVASKVCNATPW